MEDAMEQQRVAELELRLGTVEAALASGSLAGPSSGAKESARAMDEGGDEEIGLADENAALKAKLKEVQAALEKAADANARGEYRINHLIRHLNATEARVRELEGAE